MVKKDYAQGYNDRDEDGAGLLKRNKALVDELEKARDALEFYRSNWEEIAEECPYTPNETLHNDEGITAFKATKRINKLIGE